MRKRITSLLIICCLLAGIFQQEIKGQAVKGQTIRTHSIVLGKKEKKSAAIQALPMVGFISTLSYDKSGTDVQSAYDFLISSGTFTARYLTVNDLLKQSNSLGKYTALWIHRTDTTPVTANEYSQKVVTALRQYLADGGGLLLTQQAFHLITTLGLETLIPRDSTKVCADDGYGRKLGFHAFRDHSLFDGLNGGGYFQRPQRDITTRITGFFGSQVPANGKVVAVDWDYITLREESKLVVEYSAGKGRLIAAGAYMNFDEPNLNRAHLERFTKNTLEYLGGKFSGKKEFYWDYSVGDVAECENLKPETDQFLVAVPASKPWAVQPDPLSIENRYASKNFWDVAGERMLTMGSENGGIEEVWAHPFMAFRDYEVGIRFSYRDTIFWLHDERPEIVVNPAFFMRQYKFQRAYLREIVVNDPVHPAGVVHYEYRGVYPAEVIIRFKSNLRLMWPYSERATGSVCYLWDPDLNSFNIRDKSNDLNVFIGGNREPLEHKGNPSGQMQASFLLRYPLAMNDQLDLVYSASSEGYASTIQQFEAALRNPVGVYNNAISATEELLSKSLMISSPDRDFNTGYRWALIATNRFFVHTPDMGKALVAGYSTTRHGWDGGQKVSGRPGYGWYFGRDGQWSSFALLDYGDYDKVKAQLQFFNKYQDLTGKIFHEATTSGFIHYDAADATPLYIVLAGKYFRHTNDTAFLRSTWPNIKKAIDFCFSTDTDRDHLIENTNVGHGWVEGGELYGSHATIYLAASWAAAMSEAENMASAMKDIESESFGVESKTVRDIINRDFWNNGTKFFAYGKNQNGTFRSEPTILPAVPLYFKTADEERAKACLEQYAGNAFTTNWGTRIVRDDSPHFKPTGYHYGSVWPLFTGWTSLAEYAYGNYLQGYSHIMNNLNLYKNWGLGFAEEVMNGAEYQPSGVCAHQCWSETMGLQPAIEGMIGLEVFAQENRIVLSPRLPANWDSLEVSNIRIADKYLEFKYYRLGGRYMYDFKLTAGSKLNLDFMPVLPAGAQVKSVTMNGREVPYTVFKTENTVSLLVKSEVVGIRKLVIESAKGIAALPLIQEPKPGHEAAGTRIVAARLRGNEYTIDLEGVPGTVGKLEIYVNGQELESVNGGEIRGKFNQVVQIAVAFEKGTSRYTATSVMIRIK
jgi:glycogen debranching enzyme